MELETITGLQSFGDRRYYKMLPQIAKFKRLQYHPMRQRLSQPTTEKLKRGSFIHQSRILERRHGIPDHDPISRLVIPAWCLVIPAWSEGTSPISQITIPGDSHSGPERKSLSGIPSSPLPKRVLDSCLHDGTAENAVQNGEAGVYIQNAGGREDKIIFATYLYSTHYKAEVETLKAAATHIEVGTHASYSIVLTDALSILQALQSYRDTEHNCLSAALASLCRNHAVTF